MFNNDYSDLIKTLRIPSYERTNEELDLIFAFLRSIDELKRYRESLLKSIAYIIRHEEFAVPNAVIYSNGSRITCWYILLSGSIFLGGKMFLPITCFGRRIGKDTFRREDCISLEPCDLLVIDTPDLENRPVVSMHPLFAAHGGGIGPPPQSPGDMTGLQQHGDRVSALPPPHLKDPNIHRLSDPTSKRMSHSSDTSSAYSGSGELDNSVQNCDSDEELQLRTYSADGDSVQVTPELPRRSPLLVALEKDPTERSNEDIEVLLEAFQRLHAFSNFTRATQRQFAAHMLYAVVERAGQVVLDDGEKLDSWSVIVDGEVEIQRPGSAPVHLHCGDAFGVKPTTEKQHHVGVMRSLVPNCRFAFITQEPYCQVLSSEAENTIEIRASDGSLQLVKEIRTLDSGTLKKQHTIIRGTPQALIDQLLECRGGSNADPNFAEDFLLTYRTFLDSGVPIARRLLEALASPANPDQASRAVRVFLLWTNNHFNDFDDSRELFQLLLQFERQLERREDTRGAQNLLRIACSTMSRPRKIALGQQAMPMVKFHLSPNDRLCYVLDVADSGCELRIGDQVLQVNGQQVSQLPHTRLRDLLASAAAAASSPASSSHSQHHNQRLELLVRWDPLSFNKLVSAAPPPANAGAGGPAAATGGSWGRAAGGRASIASTSSSSSHGCRSSTGGGGENDSASYSAQQQQQQQQQQQLIMMKGSTSNPDLSFGSPGGGGGSELPDHVIRVFRPDGSFKLLCINRETSAREVVMLAVQEFGLTGSSSDYKLMEVSVTVGPLIRRKTLSDSLLDLGGRLALNARYYVKQQTELADQFLSDADAQEVLRESAVDFTQLDPQEVAMGITLEDFGVFQRILPTQLVDWWHKKEKASKEFNELSLVTENESTWPLSELSAEQNTTRRVRLLKHFLKVSQYCRQLNNLNTLMSLTLGLAKTQNSQLNPAWDKLPKKYKDVWKSLEKLTDIRMNHSSYRQLFKSDKFQPPAVPYLPILCKDLTAIRECNERMQDGLVNFDKLRLLAREVRGFCRYSQAGYEGHTWRGSTAAAAFSLGRGGSGGAGSGGSGLNSAAIAGAISTSQHQQVASSSGSSQQQQQQLRRAGSSSALTAGFGSQSGVGGGLGGVGSGGGGSKRRSQALVAMAKKLYDESVAAKKLVEYVSRLRQAGESEGPISQCPEVAPTAGTKFHSGGEQQFNKLMALSDGRRPAKHQHIPAPPPGATAPPAARPPLPPPYQQVMQHRQLQHQHQQQQHHHMLQGSAAAAGSCQTHSQGQPPPAPPPRSETTVATTRPAAPPPYHQAVARRGDSESAGQSQETQQVTQQSRKDDGELITFV